jgi:NTP pyrophosphatase (non-canonical NTP hydrolase)
MSEDMRSKLARDLGRTVEDLTDGLKTIRSGLAAKGGDTAETDAGIAQLDELRTKLEGAADLAFVTTLNQMAGRIHSNAVLHGFWPDDKSERNVGEMIALVHSELSELLEAVRDGGEAPSEKLDGFTQCEEEVADVLIRLLDLCTGKGWRLAEAVLAKHAHNIGRPHKHGREF